MVLKYLMCLLGLALTVSCTSDNPVINPQNLRKIFEAAKPYSDLSGAFHSIKGLELLGDKSLDAQSAKEVCDFAKAKVDKNSMESIYYAASLTSLVPNCQLDSSSFQNTLEKAESSSKVTDLYYYTMAAQTLKLKIDAKKIAKSLTDALKSDSSIVNQGFSLHIAAKLSDSNKPFYESIEDILDQADEVDKVMLQYEGGVGTTSIVLEGIFEMSEKFNSLPAKFTSERLAKFINYLISKRFPTNIKSTYFLLRTANKLTNNKFLVPIFINRLSQINVNAASSNLLVSLTNVLGGPVKEVQMNLDAVSATSSNSKSSLFSSKKAFTTKSSDRTTFEMNLVDGKSELTSGFYAVKVALNAPKNYFLTKSSVQVKVTTKISVDNVQLGVSDIDTSIPKLKKFTKVDNLEADQQSKFLVKFEVKEQNKNTLIEAHQTFLKFTETKSGREIIYIAEANLKDKTYSVEIDFSTNAKNFRYQSGSYLVDLIVSDDLFENPTILKLANMNLKLAAKSVEEKKTALYSPKPEIKHVFRKPDSRPPQAISMVFALLCLLPMALVVVLWMNIGFNFAKFEVSLSAIVFHISLASIFGLYYCYWTQINMFVTIRYLGILGLVAFFTGNKLLKSLATEKKEKAN